MKKTFYYSSLCFALLALQAASSTKSSLQIAPNDINLKFEDPLVEKNIKGNIYNKINELVSRRKEDNKRTYFWTNKSKEQVEQEVQNTFLFKKNDHKGNPYSEETLEEGEKMSYRHAMYEFLETLAKKEKINIPSMADINIFCQKQNKLNPKKKGFEFNGEWGKKIGNKFIQVNIPNIWTEQLPNIEKVYFELSSQFKRQGSMNLEKNLEKIYSEYKNLKKILTNQFDTKYKNYEKKIVAIKNEISTIQNTQSKLKFYQNLTNLGLKDLDLTKSLEYMELNLYNKLILKQNKREQITKDFYTQKDKIKEERSIKIQNCLQNCCNINDIKTEQLHNIFTKIIDQAKTLEQIDGFVNDFIDNLSEKEIKNLNHIDIIGGAGIELYKEFLDNCLSQDIITLEEKNDLYEKYLECPSQDSSDDIRASMSVAFHSMKKNDINPFMIAFYKNIEMLYKYNGLSDYSTNIALEVLYHIVSMNVIDVDVNSSLNFRDIFNIAMFIQYQMHQFNDNTPLTQQEEQKIKDEMSIRFSFYRKNEFSKKFSISHDDKEPSCDKNAAIYEEDSLNNFIFNKNFDLTPTPLSLQATKLMGDLVENVMILNNYMNEEAVKDIKNISPEEEVLSPEEEVLSPEEEVLSPEEEVLSPEEEVLSPEEEVLSPEEEVLSPEEEAIKMEEILQREKYALMTFEELTQEFSLEPQDCQGLTYLLYHNFIAPSFCVFDGTLAPFKEIALGIIREDLLEKIKIKTTTLRDILCTATLARRMASQLIQSHHTAYHEAGHCFASKKNIEYMTAITLFGDDFNGCTMPGDFLVNEGDVQNSWKEICCNVAGILGGALGYSEIINIGGASSDFAKALKNANTIEDASVEDLNQYPKIKEYMDTGLSMLEAYKNATDKNITLANINDEWKRLVSLESLKNCSANALNLIAAAIVETFKALTETEEKYKTFRTLGEKVFDEGFLNTQEIKRCLSPEFLEQNLIFSKDALMDKCFDDDNSQDKKRAALLRDGRNIFPLKLFEN